MIEFAAILCLGVVVAIVVGVAIVLLEAAMHDEGAP